MIKSMLQCSAANERCFATRNPEVYGFHARSRVCKGVWQEILEDNRLVYYRCPRGTLQQSRTYIRRWGVSESQCCKQLVQLPAGLAKQCFGVEVLHLADQESAQLVAPLYELRHHPHFYSLMGIEPTCGSSSVSFEEELQVSLRVVQVGFPSAGVVACASKTWELQGIARIHGNARLINGCFDIVENREQFASHSSTALEIICSPRQFFAGQFVQHVNNTQTNGDAG